MAPTTLLSEEIGFYFGLSVFVQLLIVIFALTLNLLPEATLVFITLTSIFYLLGSIFFYFVGIFGDSRYDYYPLIWTSVIFEFVYWFVLLLDSKDFPFEKGGKLLFLGLQFLHIALTIVFLYKDRKNAGLEKFFGIPANKFKGGISKLANSFNSYGLTKDCALERCN